jgi:tetratricopeptide (TPR) repeat protein
MSDDAHNSDDYLKLISLQTSNFDRPRCLYLSLLILPLYYFGHYEEAIKTGDDLMGSIDELWSVRNLPLALFYLALSIIAWIRENPDNMKRKNLLERAKTYQARIESWQGESDVNYLMWSLMLEAEISDLEMRHHHAIQAYEAAVDHTILNDFVLDQALATELQAGFYIRRGATRAAHSTLLDAIATYYRINAIGKAQQLKTYHEWILRSVTSVVRTADIGVQTIGFGKSQFQIEENDRQETRNLGIQSVGDRTEAWVGPGPINEEENPASDVNVASLGLDILDLQSILEFNQAISSELQIERLLAQMTEIILESAGAQADFACVVVQGEGGWCIAASGTAGNISSQVNGSI